ncbi:hypothetical protein C2E21_0382 [Chlorella sorokiniana]|uniref:Uncharacterized protein n=1 Tax=Chlorella sorokiniana TaxID=3076 RepID=A0A2P6U4K8_CHLSO|nr:hypothetical protein C2E21_0382 [Chlorella sorokiniana]|eukprot:PRW61236.1 hypothetical protein C2E21_0382 [Chlorella sorokiniana]
MAGVGAVATAAAAPAASGLAASYAAVQSTLRRQFFGDLVELRGALVNTLNLEPQRAANLHLKLQLIDAALRMLEETKAEVTSADMASLMNMSAKVVRAVEAWRARRMSGRQRDAAVEALQPSNTLQQQSASQQQQLQSASQQQQAQSTSQQQQQQQEQSKLLQPEEQQQQAASQQQQATSQQQQVTSQQQQSATSQQQQATSQQQQQQQQQQSSQARPPQVVAVCVDADGSLRSRITSPFAAPEVQLAPPRDAPTPALPPPPPTAGVKDATAAAAAAGRGDDGTGTPLSSVDQFDFLSKLIVDPVDPLSAPAVSLLPDIDWEVPEVKPSGNLDTLLPSEASQVLLAQQRTVAQKRAAARAQRMSSAEAFLARVSANAAAEGSFDAEGPGASGSLAPLPSYQQQRSQQGGVPPGLPLGPPSQPPAKQQKQHHPQQPGHRQDDQPAAAAAAARASHCPLTSPKSAATHSPVGAVHQEVSSNSGGGSRLSAGGGSLGFNGGNPHSLQLSASSRQQGELHTTNPSLVGELKLLGLSSGGLQLGSQALPPHLQTMASYTRQTAAAAQLAAADHQQAERLSALRLLQQFPHAALHGGCGALQQLLSAGDSFGAPGGLGADPAGQLQQVAALQAQQQAAQLAQVAALERYRRDQLHYQQLQQQLMQPFGGFPQLQPQAPAYHQVQFAGGSSTRPAGSGGMPALSAGAAGFPGLPGHSGSAGMPGMPVAADGQPFPVCPSLAAGASSSGAGGMWQAPNGVLAAGPHAGHAPLMQASGQHALRGASAGFGESASMSSGASSRQKRRRALLYSFC